MKQKEIIAAATGMKKAALVLKNAEYLNVFTGEFLGGDIAVEGGRFVGIGSYDGEKELDLGGKTVVPGFIDGHIHLESCMVSPVQFANAVIPHGTTAVITDPHEITNVAGTDGLEYMMQATQFLPLEVFFMMPSCVPCSGFDETGCVIGSKTVARYMDDERILGLAEMMNYPGVLAADEEVLKKIACALDKGKIVDGHAPALSGKNLNAYIANGVYSDHECSSFEEAIEKLRLGQWIMIREGTATKNLKALLPLFADQYYRRCMLVCDDKHPGDLKVQGHIDWIIRKAIAGGAKPENAYIMASFNAAQYFGLKYRGAVCPGYQADFVILDDRKNVEIDSVYKRGVCVAHDHRMIEWIDIDIDERYRNKVSGTVHLGKITIEDFVTGNEKKQVIGLIPGEIITSDEGTASGIDVNKDILKAAVVERHRGTGHIGLCYVKGYGLKSGAVATSIAHDSHNIIVIGASEADMTLAVNHMKKMEGGMVVVDKGTVIADMPLPIAGLMCDMDVDAAESRIEKVKAAACDRGVNPAIDPFMTLSFISLPVIPQLKLTTKGVVDVNRFELV